MYFACCLCPQCTETRLRFRDLRCQHCGVHCFQAWTYGCPVVELGLDDDIDRDKLGNRSKITLEGHHG